MTQSEKYEFNMVDLSLSEIASLSSSERVGIVDLSNLMFIVFQNCFLLVVFTFPLKKHLFRIPQHSCDLVSHCSKLVIPLSRYPM